MHAHKRQPAMVPLAHRHKLDTRALHRHRLEIVSIHNPFSFNSIWLDLHRRTLKRVQLNRLSHFFDGIVPTMDLFSLVWMFSLLFLVVIAERESSWRSANDTTHRFCSEKEIQIHHQLKARKTTKTANMDYSDNCQRLKIKFPATNSCVGIRTSATRHKLTPSQMIWRFQCVTIFTEKALRTS